MTFNGYFFLVFLLREGSSAIRTKRELWFNELSKDNLSFFFYPVDVAALQRRSEDYGLLLKVSRVSGSLHSPEQKKKGKGLIKE